MGPQPCRPACHRVVLARHQLRAIASRGRTGFHDPCCRLATHMRSRLGQHGILLGSERFRHARGQHDDESQRAGGGGRRLEVRRDYDSQLPHVRITGTGEACCWGANVAGQLGDSGSAIQQNVPVAVHAGGVTFSSIAAGYNHICARATSGDIYCWGGKRERSGGAERWHDGSGAGPRWIERQ